ncbi:MAG TPA: hypothetical protein PLU22_04280 [Polyangiaceae bacterium]|nr:hypothetical protein [Polyangiaceae bacterium]
MVQTGDACAAAGVYETDCEHAISRRFQVGERFPSCAGCGGVSWLRADFGAGATASRVCCPVRRDPEGLDGERDDGEEPRR